ncbi:hypothetical protein ABZ847_29455 [Streptomyces bauhiniae]
MTHQAPLIPTTTGPDLWRKFRLDHSHHVNAAPWLDAIARNAPVGTCRRPAPSGKACGGYLKPAGQPHRAGPIDWYPIRCDTCRHESAARGPAPRKRRR